jgi:hypothetical protein
LIPRRIVLSWGQEEGLMSLRHVLAMAGAGAVIGLVACSGGVDSSCGNYIDAAIAYDTKCNSAVTVPAQAKTNFVKLCEALAAAPGARDFASEIDQCSSQIQSLDCNGSLTCKITGSLPDGAACGAGSQCAGGVCSTSSTPTIPDSEMTCGTCSSYVPVGGDCSIDHCDPATSECMQNKCVAYAQQGQSCAGAPCANALLCDSTNTCQPYPTKGQSCTLACASPEVCSNGTCSDPVQQGGACPTGIECASGLTCDATSHTCVTPTLAGSGQPCGFVNNQIVDCQTGLKCSSSSQGSSTCVTPKEIGDPCTVGNSECDTFLLCVGGTCQVPDYTVCQ